MFVVSDPAAVEGALRNDPALLPPDGDTARARGGQEALQLLVAGGRGAGGPGRGRDRAHTLGKEVGNIDVPVECVVGYMKVFWFFNKDNEHQLS